MTTCNQYSHTNKLYLFHKKCCDHTFLPYHYLPAIYLLSMSLETLRRQNPKFDIQFNADPIHNSLDATPGHSMTPSDVRRRAAARSQQRRQQKCSPTLAPAQRPHRAGGGAHRPLHLRACTRHRQPMAIRPGLAKGFIYKWISHCQIAITKNIG